LLDRATRVGVALQTLQVCAQVGMLVTKIPVFFQDFFAIWKDAGRDVPILQQARSEYELLR
jgi:hypothetical protein